MEVTNELEVEEAMPTPLFALPLDVLVGQLLACAAVDLAALGAAAKAPQSIETDELPLHNYVARLALGSVAHHLVYAPKAAPPDEERTFAPSQHWLRLFHFLRCADVSPIVSVQGHLCAGLPTYVRAGTSALELPGEDLRVQAAFVLPLGAWRGRSGAVGVGAGCQVLPLPESFSVRANMDPEAVSTVTHRGQLCAVVPLSWGDSAAAADSLGDAAAPLEQLDFLAASLPQGDQQRLTAIARLLNRKGQCATLRTHRIKVHLLSLAQVRVASRSYQQPLLADALRIAGREVGHEALPLWALIYTDMDPGFYMT